MEADLCAGQQLVSDGRDVHDGGGGVAMPAFKSVLEGSEKNIQRLLFMT